MKTLTFTAVVIAATVAVAAGQGTQAANEALWEAARAGDTAAITAALAKGADVNAKSRYDVTALIFAAGSGRLEAVKLLVARGADVNAQDTFYRARAAEMAITTATSTSPSIYCRTAPRPTVCWRGRPAEPGGARQSGGRWQGHAAGTAGGLDDGRHHEARSPGRRSSRRCSTSCRRSAAPAFTVNPATLPKYAGTYRDAGSGLHVTVTVQNGALMLQMQGQPLVRLVPSAENVFRVVEVNATLTFNERGGLVESIGLVQGPANLTLARVAADAPPPPATAAAAPPPPTPPPAAARTARPTGAAQLAVVPRRRQCGQRRRTARGDRMGRGDRKEHQVEDADSRRRKSSPIVWGNRIFATTAISKAGDNSFKTGLYGDVKPVDDLSPHEWKIYASIRRPGRSVGATAVIGAPEDEAPHQEQPGQLDAGDRRPACRRGVRIGRRADRVGLSTARSCGVSTSARSTADGSSIRRSSGATRARRSSIATR